jgi:hypothetical protein
MWALDPAIRDFVGEARDYAYDWNAPGGVPGSGPLLASDDVDALLRRAIGGSPDAASPESARDQRSPTAEESGAADNSARDERPAVPPRRDGGTTPV